MYTGDLPEVFEFPSNNIGAESASRVHAGESQSIKWIVKYFRMATCHWLSNPPCSCQWNGKEMASSDGKSNSERCGALNNVRERCFVDSTVVLTPSHWQHCFHQLLLQRQPWQGQGIWRTRFQNPAYDVNSLQGGGKSKSPERERHRYQVELNQDHSDPVCYRAPSSWEGRLQAKMKFQIRTSWTKISSLPNPPSSAQPHRRALWSLPPFKGWNM